MIRLQKASDVFSGCVAQIRLARHGWQGEGRGSQLRGCIAPTHSNSAGIGYFRLCFASVSLHLHFSADLVERASS